VARESLLLLLADVILIIHVLFVVFVISGLVAIYVGHVNQWHWVRNRRFRIGHLLAIVIVVIQSWIGVICPLTTWEMALRESAGGDAYSGSFIQHWLQNLLYYSAPEWVFIILYTGFGSLVLASWFLVPPNNSMRK
jgi:Protein of Unknown function (DUF2784)